MPPACQWGPSPHWVLGQAKSSPPVPPASTGPQGLAPGRGCVQALSWCPHMGVAPGSHGPGAPALQGLTLASRTRPGPGAQQPQVRAASIALRAPEPESALSPLAASVTRRGRAAGGSGSETREAVLLAATPESGPAKDSGRPWELEKAGRRKWPCPHLDLSPGDHVTSSLCVA